MARKGAAHRVLVPRQEIPVFRGLVYRVAEQLLQVTRREVVAVGMGIGSIAQRKLKALLDVGGAELLGGDEDEFIGHAHKLGGDPMRRCDVLHYFAAYNKVKRPVGEWKFGCVGADRGDAKQLSRALAGADRQFDNGRADAEKLAAEVREVAFAAADVEHRFCAGAGDNAQHMQRSCQAAQVA